MATKSEVGNDNASRPTSSASNGLAVPQSNTAFAGNGPDLKSFKRDQEFPYNGTGSAKIMNNSMDPSGNSSPTKPNVRARPNVNMPNNGPVPGGTMNPSAQPTSGPAAPNVDPFSEGVNLPPDAMMNKTSGGMGYNMGPGAAGDAFGSAGAYGYGRGPNYPGMTNQMPPNNDLYQGPGAPNPSNPMPNSYNQYDPMNSVRTFNAPTPVSRGFGAQFGHNMPRASSSPRPPGTDRISSSAPTLSQLLQGQKPQYNFPNNYPQSDIPGRGPDHGGMPNQYWGGQPRINSSMAGQMPVGYTNRAQMNVPDNHMMSRRPYGGGSGMVPGAPPYSQQSMPQYNRQYPQMYPTQQLHRPPVSRGIYAPQAMPPPYGPQSQGMNFGAQQQPGQTPTGFGSHVQQQPQAQSHGGTTPHSQAPSSSPAQPSVPQQPPSSLAGSQGLPNPQPTSQPSQPMTSQGQVPTSSTQPPATSQHPQSAPQQQIGQPMPPHGGRSPMGQQGGQMSLPQGSQVPPMSQQGPMTHQGPIINPQGPGMPQSAPGQAMPMSQANQLQQTVGHPSQGYPSMPQQQQNWPPQQSQRNQPQDVPSSLSSQPQVKQEAPPQQTGQVPAGPNGTTQVSRVQQQETVGSRPSSLPDLSGCIDDLPTDSEAGNQSATVNSAPAVNNNQASQSPAAAAPPTDVKPKVEPGSNPPSQPATPVPQPPPTQPPAGTGVIKPSPSPVGSPASLVSRTSQSPASAHSGSVTPQPQMAPGPGNHGGAEKGMDRLTQSPIVQPNDMKGTMGRQGYRGGPSAPFSNTSAMGNMGYDNRIRPGLDPFSNSPQPQQQQQQCNDYNLNNSMMAGPGQDPAVHPMRPGSGMNMNSGNPFPPNYSGGGGPPGGSMGYKPMMNNPHIPQRPDGPYGGGPNVQRFGMRGMPPSSMNQQQNMTQGDPARPVGSYPPPYPAQQQQQWPPMQQQTPNSNHGPTMPHGGVPFDQTNNSFMGGQQQSSTPSSTTQNFTGSSTATSSSVISTANSTSDTRNTTAVTQSITMPVTTAMTVSGGPAEHMPPGQTPVMAQIIKKENEDGLQQIKMEANNSLPALPQGLSQPSPMASPSTLSKSSQEDVTSGTASPCPPTVGTPTPRPASQGNQIIQQQQPPQKKANDTTSNGLVLNRKVMKLYELSDDPNRKLFLDALLKFMDDRGQPIKTTPQVASHILDLFRLYYLVKEKGGVVKVSKTKQWKSIAATLAIGNSNSAAYTLKKNYIRYLLPYDCYYDRNNLDPALIIAEIDTTGSKKKKAAAAAAKPGVVGSPMFNNVPYDQYGPRHPKPGYPPYSNQMHPSMYPQHQMGHPRGGPMPPNNVPQMPNSMGNNITVRDPFSEMDTPHMPSTGNPAYNSAYPSGGPMGPGQYRPTGGMPNNDMYNQGLYGDMRNSGGIPPANPSDPFAAMARRDVLPGMGGKPEAFNRGGPTIPPPSAEPYPTNQSGGPAGMHPGAAPNSVQQFQQGSQERPFVPPSPSSQPPQSSTPVASTSSTAAPNSSSNTSSSSMPPHGTQAPPSMGQQQQSAAGGYRFPTPNMGTRAPTSNTQTYPPPPYSGAATGPYGDQSQQQQQPVMATGPHMAQGTPPQATPTNRFPDPNSSPFPPSKRPSDSFSPVASKRQDTMGHQPGHIPPDAGQMPPNMPPYSQGFYPDGGDRPHPPGGGHPHGPGHPGGFPFGPRSTQPGPMPPHQGMKRDGFPSSDPMGGGMHPGMPWGPMKQPRPMPSSGMRGPPPGGYQGTLQQALTGNYPRERYQPSGGLKPAKLPQHQLPTMSPHKKEVVFPPNSIEASQPTTMKVQRKTGKDVGSVEFWRVMMALKSGLLAESTWALDILSVLLYDDNTVVSFDLKQLKGLLELLVDYYRAVLKLIFGGFQNSGEEMGGALSTKRQGEECEKVECGTPSKRRRTRKRWHRTQNHSDLERLKGADKAKLVKLDSRAKSGPLHKLCSEESSDDERKHLEVLPLRIIHQFDTTESTECLSQKYIQEPGEDDDSEEWQRYCSEELRLVKGHSRLSTSSSKTKKLMYTSQCRQRPDESVVVLEDEEMRDDVPSMITRNDAQVSVSKRCKCISNILRGLSFIPANSQNFASNPGLLALLGRILLLDHGHAERQTSSRRYGERTEGQEDGAKDGKESSPESDWFEIKEEATDYEGDPISCDNWSMDCLNSIREDALVIINNISGQLDFSLYQESISLPILDGLLHWSVCLSACALDPFPLLPANSPLSPKRLSVEALAKLSLRENNVDMILATPPFERLERLFGYLTQYVGDRKEPVLRELAIVLLSSLAQEEMLASRSIACQKSAVSFLLCYLEDAEYARSLEKDHSAAQFIVGSDIQSPNGCMMRRATSALASLARVPENHPLFLQHQTRLLNLSMSPLVDSSVRELIAEALFHLGSAG